MMMMMMMAPLRILILSLYIICLVEAVELNERSFISVKAGESVTLSCKVEKSDIHVKAWYKQQLWQKPKEVASKLDNKPPILHDSTFSVNGDFSLTIKSVSKDDEGMYFCGQSDGKTFTFFNIIVLAVTDHLQLNLSVLQTPVSDTVSRGQSVTLQCTILSDTQAKDLQVLWFRAASGQSFPEIIYTHNSSSRQCEISSSTNCSLYEFSKNILNHHHTGTYYCAVAACGKIFVGNGASVKLKGPVDPVVICLGAALGVCVVVIFAQTFIICKRRNSDHCSGKTCQSVIHSFPEMLQDQDSDEELSFVPLNFSAKSRLLKENIFTRVRFFAVSDFKPIQKHNIAEKRRK